MHRTTLPYKAADAIIHFTTHIVQWRPRRKLWFVYFYMLRSGNCNSEIFQYVLITRSKILWMQNALISTFGSTFDARRFPFVLRTTGTGFLLTVCAVQARILFQQKSILAIILENRCLQSLAARLSIFCQEHVINFILRDE